jgi:hypothetical protein
MTGTPWRLATLTHPGRTGERSSAYTSERERRPDGRGPRLKPDALDEEARVVGARRAVRGKPFDLPNRAV